MREDEIMRYSAYGAYNNVYKKNEIVKEKNEQLTPNFASLEVILQKMKNKEPVSEEEKQFAIDELSKQGKPLGEIKEEYPQLDVLVAKEFEAVALGKNIESKEELINKQNEQEDFGLKS